MQKCFIPQCVSNSLNVSDGLDGGLRSALCDAIMHYSTMFSNNLNASDGLDGGLRSALCDARMLYSTMVFKQFQC